MAHPLHTALRSVHTSVGLLVEKTYNLPDSKDYKVNVVEGTFMSLLKALGNLAWELGRCHTVRGQQGQINAGGEVRPLPPMATQQDAVLETEDVG